MTKSSGDSGVTIRRARAADLPAICALVDGSGLSGDGLDAATVFVAEQGGRTVGAVALEQHGGGSDTAFLLRSAAVVSGGRRRGIGEALIRTALRHVDALRAPVGLLTETAELYFPRFGFVPVDRAALPGALLQSAQLQGACPDTARAMLRPAVAAANRTRH